MYILSITDPSEVFLCLNDRTKHIGKFVVRIFRYSPTLLLSLASFLPLACRPLGKTNARHQRSKAAQAQRKARKPPTAQQHKAPSRAKRDCAQNTEQVYPRAVLCSFICLPYTLFGFYEGGLLTAVARRKFAYAFFKCLHVRISPFLIRAVIRCRATQCVRRTFSCPRCA